MTIRTLTLIMGLFVALASCAGGSNANIEICNNGIDDDNDGLKDCADEDCFGDPACPNTNNTNNTSNTNNTNNVTTETDCSNGTDDDGDGDVDCDDSDCVDDPACPVEICDNGTDDDGDGDVDCDDEDCFNEVVCGGEDCGNGIDDDGDGDVDCDDGDCSAAPACLDEICNDGIDNDADGFIDCADSECVGNLGPGGIACQATETSCADAGDNDGDGLIDCLDPDCAGRVGPGGYTCQITETSCADGGDNDGDGDVDCADSDCVSDAACLGTCDDTTVFWDYSGPATCPSGQTCGLVSGDPPTADCLDDSEFGGSFYASCALTGVCPFGAYCVSGSCYPLCKSATNPDCPDGDCLYGLTVGGNATDWDLCKQTDGCDPVDNTGCAAEDTCYLIEYAHCLTTNTAPIAVGDACSYIDDCVAGAACFGTCYALCHLSGGTTSNPDCSAGQTCVDYGEITGTYGGCVD